MDVDTRRRLGAVDDAGATGGYLADNAPTDGRTGARDDGRAGVAAHALDPGAAERLWAYAELFTA